MVDNARLSALIGHIYDCVPDPSRWDELLGDLCQATESEVGTLSVVAPHRRRLRFGGVHGPSTITEPLTRKYAQHMPFFDVLPAMHPGHPYLLSDMMGMIGDAGREVLEDTVMYREWNKPHGLTESYCIALFKKPDEVVCLNLVLSQERRSVTKQDRQQVAALVPHIQRAARLASVFDRVTHQNLAMQQVVEQMTNSLLIVSVDMRILHANLAAEKMLGEGTVIRSTRGKLTIVNPAAAARIVQDVTLGSSMEEQLEGANISIPLGDIYNPSIAHVIPLGRRDLDRRFANGAAAAIVIAEAKRDADLASEAFRDLYALTTAEQRIAHFTAQGLGRAAIADTIGIKESTVKSHLESIFRKTGTSGQIALTILMRSLSPPLR